MVYRTQVIRTEYTRPCFETKGNIKSKTGISVASEIPPIFSFGSFLLPHPLKLFLPPANEVLGKVIFLHLSVILFTGEVPPVPEAGNPPHRTRDTPHGTMHTHPLPDQRQAPPGSDTPAAAVHAGRWAQQAGGTHPTGMQSCIDILAGGSTDVQGIRRVGAQEHHGWRHAQYPVLSPIIWANHRRRYIAHIDSHTRWCCCGRHKYN